MDYNSNRKRLPLPEYGRNIQNMVDYLMTIEDKEKRNKSALTVIDVMGNLYPYLRDVAEFKHKLWDHLAIMSDFKLDIDYPYNPPSPDILTNRPSKVPYNQNRIKYRHYGLVIEKMIAKTAEFEGDQKKSLSELLANQMKKSYLAWNKDAVQDEKIFLDIIELSGGDIKLDKDLVLTETKTILGKKKKKNNGRKK